METVRPCPKGQGEEGEQTCNMARLTPIHPLRQRPRDDEPRSGAAPGPAQRDEAFAKRVRGLRRKLFDDENEGQYANTQA